MALGERSSTLDKAAMAAAAAGQNAKNGRPLSPSKARDGWEGEDVHWSSRVSMSMSNRSLLKAGGVGSSVDLNEDGRPSRPSSRLNDRRPRGGPASESEVVDLPIGSTFGKVTLPEVLHDKERLWKQNLEDAKRRLERAGDIVKEEDGGSEDDLASVSSQQSMSTIDFGRFEGVSVSGNTEKIPFKVPPGKRLTVVRLTPQSEYLMLRTADCKHIFWAAARKQERDHLLERLGLGALCSRAKTRFYDPGAVMVNQGQEKTGEVLLILEGEADMVVNVQEKIKRAAAAFVEQHSSKDVGWKRSRTISANG